MSYAVVRSSASLLVFCLSLSLVGSGCKRDEPPAAQQLLDGARCRFAIYWPPRDPYRSVRAAGQPLLRGVLRVDVAHDTRQKAEVRLVITLTRPSTESDRQFWNSRLAFADIGWMESVRVWDKDERWLWPNLPYLLRLPGKERVERYGGVDPGKLVDNDFAAVLVRKYLDDAETQSADTLRAPLVSADWHAVNAEKTDLRTIVHRAESDTFVLHVGNPHQYQQGHFKVWLIYADFLGSRPPSSWPAEREWAGGILAYFEVDWKKPLDGPCQGTVRHRRPPHSTHFDWENWVDTATAESRGETRLTDQP